MNPLQNTSDNPLPGVSLTVLIESVLQAFRNVPLERDRALLAMQIHIHIERSEYPWERSQRNVMLRCLWQEYHSHRAISGTVQQILPVMHGLLAYDLTILHASLCYTHGRPQRPGCTSCADRDRLFDHCVVLPSWFGDRCANCIVNRCLDCSPRRGDTTDEDDSEVNSSRAETLGLDDGAHLGHGNSRARDARRSGTHSQYAGDGTAMNPYDLTEVVEVVPTWLSGQ